MSSSTVFRLSGVAAIVGFAVYGVIGVVYELVFPDSVPLSVLTVSNTWFALHLLIFIALLIGLLGLLGLYARQAEQTGVLGLIAVLMTSFGLALFFALEWSETFLWPVFAHAVPQFLDHPDPNVIQALLASQTIHTVLGGVGLLLFGVASLRAAVLPRGAATLLIVGAVLGLVVNLMSVEIYVANALAGVLVSLGIVWMGYAVWSRPPAAAEPTTPMTASGPSLANR